MLVGSAAALATVFNAVGTIDPSPTSETAVAATRSSALSGRTPGRCTNTTVRVFSISGSSSTTGSGMLRSCEIWLRRSIRLGPNSSPSSEFMLPLACFFGMILRSAVSSSSALWKRSSLAS